MIENNNTEETIEWFKMFIAFLSSIILALIYIFVPQTDNTSELWKLILACIPSGIVVLIAVPIVYLILYKRGLTLEQKIKLMFKSMQHPNDSSIFNEHLLNIVKDIETIKKSQSVEDYVILRSKLESIEKNVDNLRNVTQDIANTISNETRNQHQALLNIVQKKHEGHTVESRDVLINAVKNELDKLIPNSREKELLHSSLISLVEHSITNMGKYQQETYKIESDKLLTKVEDKIVTSFNKVIDEVEDLKNKVETLPVLYDQNKSNSIDRIERNNNEETNNKLSLERDKEYNITRR